MANVQQRARGTVLGRATALGEAEAREHIADAAPEETRAKIDAALRAAPVISRAGVGGWHAAPARPKPTRPRSGLAYRVDELAQPF
jgi:hypothetical protein